MQVSAPFEPAIVARNLESMVAFYRDVLGMTVFSTAHVEAGPSRLAGLSEHGCTIVRLDTAGGDRLKIVVPEDPPTVRESTHYLLQRAGFSYVTFIVPDVRACIAAVSRHGGTVRTGPDPVAFRPGIVELAVAEDPEGNCIEFVQRNDFATYRPVRTSRTA
jgi:lactoylglutathione lyase